MNPDVLKNSHENLVQIKKDITRTFPTVKTFQKESFQQKLMNVLIAYSNYDKEIRRFIIRLRSRNEFHRRLFCYALRRKHGVLALLLRHGTIQYPVELQGKL